MSLPHSADGRPGIRSPRPERPACSKARKATSRSKIGGWLALALAGLAASSPAQSFKTFGYSEVDGLPSVTVHDVAQGANGVLWFATQAGLTRFDGETWEVREELDRVLGPVVGRVEASEDGTLWACGLHVREGFARGAPDGRQWHFIAPPPDDVRVLDMKPVPGVTNALLVMIEGGRVLQLEGDAWSTHDEFGGDRRAEDLEVVGDVIVVATSLGVSVLDDRAWRHDLLASAGVEEREVFAVAADGSELADGVWLIGGGWVGRLTGDEYAHVADNVQPELGQHGPDQLPPRAAVRDGAGGVWFGNFEGVAHFDKRDGLRQLDRSDGLTANGCGEMLRDRSGNVWLVDQRGVTCIPSLRFANYKKQDGLLGDEVTALAEASPGRLVFGHVRGLSVLERGRFTTLDLERPGFPENYGRVLDLAIDADGAVWAARRRAGVTRLSRDGMRRTFRHDDLHLTAGVLAARDGRLWVVGNGGFFEVVDEQLVKGAGPDADPLAIRRAVELSDGRLCLATTHRGVYLGRPGEWSNVRHPTSSAANSTYGAIETASGQILVGSSAGVWEVSGNDLVPPRDEALRLDEPVYSILVDPEGELWLGTQRGLLRWDGVQLTRLTVDNGLPGNEVNRAAALIDHTGSLWFGTIDGAARYRRHHDLEKNLSVPLELHRMEVNGVTRPLPAAAGVSLAHDENSLGFSFRAISFGDRSTVCYRVRLEGFDPEWIHGEAVDSGFVRYTNLPPGEYRFTAQAHKEGRGWGELQTSGAIHIDGPFWQTPWFLLLASAIVGGSAFGVHRFRYVRRHSEELDRLVVLRTEELRGAERRYREVFEKSGLPQLLVDCDGGRIIDANPAALTLYDAESLNGRTFAELHMDRDVSVETGPDDDPSRSVSARHRTASGAVRDLEIFTCAYELEGTKVAHLIVCDVTEKLLLEKELLQAQKMESVGRLAAGVAHDFNNLLTAIIGYAQLTQETRGLPAEAHRAMDAISSAGSRGAELTRQLLGFARKQVSRPEVVHVNSTLLRMHSMLRRVLREEIEIELALDDDAGSIQIDPFQLDQVILNLAVNAADAIPAEGRLVVGTHVTTVGELEPTERGGLEAGRYVVITVTDTGAGMSESTREKAFEPFFTTKAPGKGTGLGLATCHGILKQNQGDIRIESEPGRGTTVEVLLPRFSGRAGSNVAPRPTQRRAGGSETVLLVEDNDLVRPVLARALRHESYTVLEAASLAEGREVAVGHAGSIDLLVSDVVMPGGSGVELYKELSRTMPDLRVLFISGYADDTLAEHGLDAARIALLSKPFELDELTERVREVLDLNAARTHGSA